MMPPGRVELKAPATPRSTGRERRKGRTARTWLRRVAYALVTLAIVVSLIIAWMPKPVPVDVAPARRGWLRVTVDEDGRTRIHDRYVISAPIGGRVDRIVLHAGDAIDKGAPLARLMPTDPPLLDARTRAEAKARLAGARAAQRQSRAAIERARLALDDAQRETRDQRKLASQGTVASRALERTELGERTRAAELTSAEFAARVSDHEADMAAAALRRLHGATPSADDEQFVVPSPISGRVLRIVQQSEGVVRAGAPLLEIGDPAALEVVVDILTSDAVQVSPGARVAIERWGGDRPLAAHVRLVEPSAFTRVSALGVDEQRVNVVIDLDEPREKWTALGDGYRVEARIIVWEAPDVLLIPANAVFRHGDVWAVFADEGGRARLRDVDIGRRGGVEVDVLRGLEERARVVVHPSDRVSDGVRIEPR